MRSRHDAATDDPPQMALRVGSTAVHSVAIGGIGPPRIAASPTKHRKDISAAPRPAGVALYLAAKWPLDRARKRSRPVRVTIAPPRTPTGQRYLLQCLDHAFASVPSKVSPQTKSNTGRPAHNGASSAFFLRMLDRSIEGVRFARGSRKRN